MSNWLKQSENTYPKARITKFSQELSLAGIPAHHPTDWFVVTNEDGLQLGPTFSTKWHAGFEAQRRIDSGNFR